MFSEPAKIIFNPNALNGHLSNALYVKTVEIRNPELQFGTSKFMKNNLNFLNAKSYCTLRTTYIGSSRFSSFPLVFFSFYLSSA